MSKTLGLVSKASKAVVEASAAVSKEVALAGLANGASVPWEILMALYAYPLPAFMRNVTFILIDYAPVGSFPYRAVLKTPVFHPKLDGYRLCPNFPEVCVNEKGDVLPVRIAGMATNSRRDGTLDKLTITVENHGDYLYIPVPGRNRPEFVSRFHIYGDAWANPVPDPSVRHNFSPKDGNYTNLSVQNVVRTTPWKKGKQKKFLDNSDGADNDYFIIERSSLNAATIKALERSEQKGKSSNWWLYPCSYTDLNIVSKRRSGTSIDWCFNRYWAMCIYTHMPHALHATAYVGTSWRDLEVQSGVPKKLLKQLHKSTTLKSTEYPIVFSL